MEIGKFNLRLNTIITGFDSFSSSKYALLTLLFGLCMSFPVLSQTHRATISASGSTVISKSGIAVTQSVAQQSKIGSVLISQGQVINQGFQQPNWNVLVKSSGKSLEIKVTPNPFEDIVFMSIKGEVFVDLNCQVYDIAGRFVRSFTVDKDKTHFPIDISGLEAASYLLVIEHNAEKYYKVLLKI
jgi:hypothetical protein